jgi:hypothetical protein
MNLALTTALTAAVDFVLGAFAAAAPIPASRTSPP